MYGGLLLTLLGEINIMLASLMIIVNLFGFIFCGTNLKFLRNFMNSSNLLKGVLIGKLSLSRLMGGI
jgi:hypothetical protein